MKLYLLDLVCLSLLYDQMLFLFVRMVICVRVCSYPYCPGCQSQAYFFTFLLSRTEY